MLSLKEFWSLNIPVWKFYWLSKTYFDFTQQIVRGICMSVSRKCEMLMADAVSKLAAKTPGKEAVAMESFAKALRMVIYVYCLQKLRIKYC